jgi:hypothetical protein
VYDITPVEGIEIGNPFFGEEQLMVQLMQGLPAIGLKIPQGMIEVEEKVFILHGFTQQK